jgi:hypothetical protein
MHAVPTDDTAPQTRPDLGFREAIEALGQSPSGYIPFFSPETAIAFVQGLEFRDGHDPLRGFQPWLAGRLGGGTNVGWCGLARIAVRPGEPLPVAAGSEEDAKARAVLELVLEYLRETAGNTSD